MYRREYVSKARRSPTVGTLPATKADKPRQTKNLRTLIIIFNLIVSTTFGQLPYRQNLSSATNSVLTKMDSLFIGSNSVEFRTIGEGSKISDKYLLYADLTKVATEKELLLILDNKDENAAIRGYAYMGYVYVCDKEKKNEKQFNYKFTVYVLSGCLGGTYTFPLFVKKVHTRRPFDPNPRKFVVDQEEKEAIKTENKIRKEQGENERKKDD
jgi:hypothetical protein